MQIGFSFFIGILLSLWLLLGFFLELIDQQRVIRLKKDIVLQKRKCEICASTYFVANLFGFWRCPLCKSINK